MQFSESILTIHEQINVLSKLNFAQKTRKMILNLFVSLI
jgi:hypothetical protein